MYSINFGSIISTFIAGMGVDAGTDVYFRLESDDAIFDIYEECRKSYPDDEECVKQFFNKVLSFYKDEDGICKYEKTVFPHNIRISCELNQWFESQRGSKKEILMKLMNDVIPKPDIQFTGKDCNLTFKLTYTEQEYWNSLPGDDDPSKLQSLLL
jgi:hypothetical protein